MTFPRSTARYTPSLATTLLAALFVVACAGAPAPATAPTSESVASGPIVPATSAIDDRSYRAFELENGLEVLVISDPATDKAAAALAVEVGSFDEDDDRLGLAHFLEHMLFLGTEKYPDPNEYGEYIAARGGSRNAYTALDHTNYFFSIAADELYGGLDRFAQFFVAPLFTAELVDREKNAVHSEYQMQLRDDGWRTYMTQKRALNPEHPGSRFTIGSLETLADSEGSSVREDLLEFYADHYTAERMALVLLGREELDTLTAWAEELFSPVPSRPVEPDPAPVPVYAAEDLPSLMRMQPVKERRVLELSFALPATDPVYRVNPGGYLSNLIGHEGEGSLHARLTELGWIESLAASSSRFGKDAGMLGITIELTESGLENWERIGEFVFAYLEQLRDGGVAQSRYEEQSRLAELAFRYREKSDAFGYVSSLASNMLVYPTEDVIRGPYVLDEYDEDLIDDFLDRLRPEFAQVALIAPDLETDRVERWFDVPYAVEPLDPAVLARWQQPEGDPAVTLPAPNPFVPETLELLADGAAVPERLATEDALELWHLRDTEFGAPRARMRVELRTDRASASPEDAVAARLYARLVMDALNEYAYPARLAGLSFGLYPAGNGLALSVGGFDDKLDELLERVVVTMATLEIREERFEQFRSELIKDLRNSRQDRPYQQTIAELRRVLEDPAWTLEALIAAAEATEPADIERWVVDALDRPEVLAFVHGNVTAERARTLAGAVASGLALDADAAPATPEAIVRLGANGPSRRHVEVEHGDAALTLYVQGRDQSWAERARFGLLAHMMSAPYFNDLRTERQLGYVVTAQPWIQANTPGVIFLVQSPVAPANAIEAATAAFLDSFRADLATMSEAEFEAERAGLLSSVLEADKNLGDRSNRLWTDLDAGLETFDSRERVAEAIESLDLAALRAFADEFAERFETGRLAVWTRGAFPDTERPAGAEITDLAAFKAARGRFSQQGIGGAGSSR
ncbi:MAG: insulinase family protein [Pseudomonadales bacterium]|nr:insulinase family protein [Pseudomonadales bacterium]